MIRLLHKELFDDTPEYCICGYSSSTSRLEIGYSQIIGLCPHCAEELVNSVREYQDTKTCGECLYYNVTGNYKYYPHCDKKNCDATHYVVACTNFKNNDMEESLGDESHGDYGGL